MTRPGPAAEWRTVSADEGLAQALARDLGVPAPVARLLVSRGIADARQGEGFLNPRLSQITDPFLMPGLRAAADRVGAAIARREPIVVFGDYDADGITATALLVEVVSRLGGSVAPFLPERVADGYGFTVSALTRCLERHAPALIITADCGVGAHEAVQLAAERGVEVVVTDHHELSREKPAPAAATVNPKLGAPGGAAGLAGVGVAFKLCHGLVKRGLESGQDRAGELDLREYLDLVALGTIADVAALTGENRVLVRHGLAQMARTRCCGLKALMQVAAVSGPVEAYHVAFMLGPRINAAGRMGTADTALELLLTRDPAKARSLALVLDQANRERKAVEDEIRAEAEEAIRRGFDGRRDFGLVAHGEGWHVGTLGIVASRLCDAYCRPAAVIAFGEGDVGRGSCRSISGVSLVEVLRRCSDLLVSYGGHDLAAGLSVMRPRLAEFRERFSAACAEALGGREPRPVLDIDGWIGLGEVDDALYEAIQKLRPLGEGNPTPVWGSHGLQVVGPPRVMGRDGEHVRLTMASGARQMPAVGFRMAKRTIPDGPIDAAFQIQMNEYMGRRSLELHLKDFRPHQP